VADARCLLDCVVSVEMTRRRRPKERAAATPPARTPAARNVSIWMGAIGVLGATALGLLVLRAHSSGDRLPTTPPPVANTAALLGLDRRAPPWPAEANNLRARLRVLGLSDHAGTRIHTHQHLDVFVNGSHVAVPARIGINLAERVVSPIHTHDASGLVHVESPTFRSFSLAEFFGVWGVRLTKMCLGGACGPGQLHVFVNGRRVEDPNLALLGRHAEIVVAFGSPPAPLPASYSFPSGT